MRRTIVPARDDSLRAPFLFLRVVAPALFALMPAVVVAPARAGVCFPPAPTPECSSFLLVESGVDQFLGGTLEVGPAWNESARHALGAALSFHLVENSTALGVRGRYRRWLGRRSSVDVALGVHVLPLHLYEDDDERLGAGGFSGQVALNPHELIGLAVKAEWQRARPEDGASMYYALGVRMGGWAGVGGAVVGAGMLGLKKWAEMFE